MKVGNVILWYYITFWS